MAILAYGLSYRTAPLDLRERLAFPEDGLRDALRDLTARVPDIAEAAILSTCNRTELYCAVAADGRAAAPSGAAGIERPAWNENPLRDWLADARAVPRSVFDDHLYVHWDQDAARHVIRVAAGLDSQVLGEPQILGQMKSAWETSRASGVMGPQLGLLSDVTLNVAKRIRSETDIGRNPVSVAYAAVSLARSIFSDLGSTRALLVGAGETIELVAEHLVRHGAGSLTVANRSLPNARRVAERFRGEALPLTDVAEALHGFDVVIASTGSPLPVIGKGAVEAALRRRRARPMFMVDIAVPRDIEPEVEALRDVYLYTIDDLGQIIEQNNAQRRDAASRAETIVHEGAEDFLRKRRLQGAGDLLRALRDNAGATKDAELDRALAAFERDGDAAAALNGLAHALTNKLIHAPTQALRNAAAEGRTDLVDLLRDIYGLE